MPQLWVTYDELGRHFDCDPLAAREHVVRSQWRRRKCSDGATRVKLPPPVMEDYIRCMVAPVASHPSAAFAARLPHEPALVLMM